MNASKVVLLVEDDANDIDLFRRAVDRLGLPVRLDVVRDGADAFEQLVRAATGMEGSLPRLPHLVLLDIKMPRASGLDALRAIRSNPRLRHLPVVVFSSSNDPQDIAAAMDLGANSFVQKPMRFPDLQETLRRIFDYWLHLDITTEDRSPAAPPTRPE